MAAKKHHLQGDTASISQACTHFVSCLTHKDIPEEATDAVKRYFLDWLGCAIAGSFAPQAEHIRKTLRDLGSGRQAGAIGEPVNVSTCHAAMCNGYYGHALEMDDVDRTSISHPATVNIPAALAVAEWRNKTGAELLTAIVAGYEVMLRIGTAVTPGHYEIWHTTATTGVFGSAMAAGKLLDLERGQLDWALGSAGTMSAGLWEFLADGAASKLLHAGMAAHNGILAAQLAENGLSAATRILEGKQGFFAGYARQAVNPAIFQDFGNLWRSALVSFKPYPCCRHTHSAIDAANAIRLQAAGEAIASADISTYGVALQVAGNDQPSTTTEAKFSIRYCVASALLRGLAREEHFTPQAIADPALRSLLDQVCVSIDPGLDRIVPEQWPCRIRARTVGGREIDVHVNDPKGDPENTMTWEEVKTKFRLLTQNRLSSGTADEVIDLCESLEEIKDCAAVMRAVNKDIRH